MTLEARGLGVGYGRTAIGRDIDLSVAPGEVVCLLGPNGCGKTTLIKTCLGLLPPQEGAVRLDGDALESLARPEIARRLAYVPQAHAPAFPYTAVEMALMGRAARLGLFAQPGPKDQAAATAALERLGIADLAAAEVTRLSGGQRQLVLIARALAQEARILVMDEPTANLDFGNQALVLAEIGRLARAGFGVLLTTHDPDHAFAVADRAVLMQAGRVLADGAPVEAMTAERLSALYGVPVRIERLSDGGRVCAPSLGQEPPS